MKIFSTDQVKKWDAFTILNEPISTIELMERAATACFNWLKQNINSQKQIRFFCGKGNNGGDGLAIARLLLQEKYKISVYILENDKAGSPDFETNHKRLRDRNVQIFDIGLADFFPEINEDDIIIDALFGTGLNKPLEGIFAALVEHINASNASIISIDLPTGLFADKSSKNNTIIKATHTFSFQNYKLAFLLPDNAFFCGQVHILDIGLDKQFNESESAGFELTDNEIIKTIYKHRSKFGHKENYGHAALVCSSKGMIGAVVLASLGCMSSGAGKLTAYIPECGNDIIQTTVPEAMSFIAGEDFIMSVAGIEKFDAVGIGPGIGLFSSHKDLLASIFQKVKGPLVIDADALNCIAQNPDLLKSIPAGTILTPHPKEFERLFGKTDNDFERLQLALHKSKELNIYIVLKGHYSFISTPEGKGYFNSTGNPGMATAGSGDVLTGFITGLLAQGYSSLHACILGVYLHGLAGDIAADKFSEEAMIAGDIINCLGDAFKQISS